MPAPIWVVHSVPKGAGWRKIKDYDQQPNSHGDGNSELPEQSPAKSISAGAEARNLEQVYTNKGCHNERLPFGQTGNQEQRRAEYTAPRVKRPETQNKRRSEENILIAEADSAEEDGRVEGGCNPIISREE